MEKIVLPPNPARLIEGLRDTGYDFNTALSDIVDNSVDAGASSIDILINMDASGDIYIAVADNGCGMDKSTLMDGMTYGAKGVNDAKRLGKFGLGLKTASTAFCRKLSVITRDEPSATLLKAVWDLDHVVNASDWEMILDEPSAYEVELFEKTAKNSSGTLVVWEKVDRLLKNYANPSGKDARRALDKVIKSFRDHVAMIYQRFLDIEDTRARNVSITVNEIPVTSWSPFCESEAETEMVADCTQTVSLSNGKQGEFSIKAFILPRREHFSTPEAASEARLTNNMQGIYIYRENRLIHPADWLGMFSKEPHLTLLRIEFSFDHTLDDAFQVDLKKSRIILNEDLYNWILNEFIPAPRRAADERYRTGIRLNISETAKNAHTGSNRSIQEKEEDIVESVITVVDKETETVDIRNKSGSVRLKLTISDVKTQGQMSVQPVDSIEDNVLWRPALIGTHHAVQINTGHPYYLKVYIPNLNSDVTIQGMDSLLWALAEAELTTVNEKTKNHFEDMRFEVSRILRKLVEDLPDPEFDNNGN